MLINIIMINISMLNIIFIKVLDFVERMRKRERTTMLINEAEVLEATHASLQVIDLHGD